MAISWRKDTASKVLKSIIEIYFLRVTFHSRICNFPPYLQLILAHCRAHQPGVSPVKAIWDCLESFNHHLLQSSGRAAFQMILYPLDTCKCLIGTVQTGEFLFDVWNFLLSHKPGPIRLAQAFSMVFRLGLCLSARRCPWQNQVSCSSFDLGRNPSKSSRISWRPLGCLEWQHW